MYKIQTLDKISSKGLELFSREDYEVASEIKHPDAIVLRSFSMHKMKLPESLLAIARAGAGTNNIPIEKCSEKGIVVFNTPGANANAVKELVFTGMLLASRDIVEGIAWVHGLKKEGQKVPELVEKGKSQFAGQELKGKKLGVVGLGAIGVIVANDALALGMEVIGYDPLLSIESAWKLSRNVQKATGLETLLGGIDYLTIHAPLMESTKEMFDSEKFAMMKDGVKIMNFARGGLVNNDALKSAIASGKVSAYVTDFPDGDLLDIKQVIPIPHLGASTGESEDNCAVMACTQVKHFLETGNIKNSVNFPNCEQPRIAGAKRVIIANKNMLSMISEITSLLAKHNINIANMLNKSKGNLAYSIIDIEYGDLPEPMIDKLRAIKGVIMARIIE